MSEITTDTLLGTPLDTDDLLQQLRAEAARILTRRRTQKTLHLAQVTAYLASVLIVFFHGLHHKEGRFAIYGVGLLCSLLLLLFIGERRSRTQRKCALILKLQNEVRSVGPLATIVLHKASPDPVRLAIMNLKTLLPRLQAANATELTPEYMDAVLHLLNSDDGELVIATLRGLEQVGDGTALRAVRKLASQTEHLQVQAAAQECLPCLEERARQQARSQMLLRPSQAEPAAPAVLLRPATATSQDADGKQLLRPTGQG